MLDIVKKLFECVFVCDDFTNNSTAPIKLLCLILGNIWLPYFIWLFYVAIKYLIIEVNYQKRSLLKYNLLAIEFLHFKYNLFLFITF
ncbi:hypothetical protein ECZU03_27860 [Escherichia coli]|nr:hypothetical protein ECZU03_27860 [Escherichia coli]